MYYIYTAIFLILLIIIYGSISRRNIYKKVDRLEAWKIEMMNRPITEEISKVKGLNMSGQTEEKFESWRHEWDDIITVQLPDIEEYLFDIDEMANKYRFIKAKGLIANVNEKLAQIEARLIDMTNEIHDLVHSEEQNRTDIIEVRAYFAELKKKFISQRVNLGNAVVGIEQRVKDMENSFTSFEQLTEKGNYFQARELLLLVKEQIQVEVEKIDMIPELLIQFESTIPGQLNDLQAGIREMEANGFVLEQFQFEKIIDELRQQTDEGLKMFEQIDLMLIQQYVDRISHEIEQLYDTLEEEVISKQFVQQELVTIGNELAATHKAFLELQRESEIVQLSYRITERDMKLHHVLEQQLVKLAKKYTVIEDVTLNQKNTFTFIKKLVEEFQIELKEVIETTRTCMSNLNTLRKDELLAKESLIQLRLKILDGKKLLQKSNIPGLPQKLIIQNEEAEKIIINVTEKLNEVPLEMEEVNEKLQEALEITEDSYQLILETIEKSMLVERLIQYGNRYRTNYPMLHVELLEAEHCFRSYEYDEAIDIAVKAIEQIEPNVLEKINEMMAEKV